MLTLAGQALTPQTVDSIVRPTLNDVLSGGGRYDVVSIGFVLALWSGSRALNVFVDTITIMYGLGGQRGIVRTRALSFLLYVLGMITGVITIPLVVAGPTLVAKWLPDGLDWLNQLYWPTVLVLASASWRRSTTCRCRCGPRWRYNLPGAVFTMFCWVFGSALLRIVLVGTASGSTSIYGPLAAPIAVLLWLYLLSIAVLIGAALNAAFDQIWPQKELTIGTARAAQAAQAGERAALAELAGGRGRGEGPLREGERPCREDDATAIRHLARLQPRAGLSDRAAADNPVRTPGGPTYIAVMTGAVP